MHKILSSLVLFLFCTQTLFCDDWFAYVGTNSNAVTPINLSTNTPLSDIPVLGTGDWIAITPDRLTAYVVNGSNDTVTPIDILTNTTGTPIPVGSSPEVIAITPDGKRAYVTNRDSSNISVIDTSNNTSSIAFTSPGDTFGGIAISPDGTKAYVPVFGGTLADQVIQLDITTTPATFITSIPVGLQPFSIAIKPDGTKAYVVNRFSSDVTPIDLTGPIPIPEPPIPVGTAPIYVAITPDGETIFVSSNSDNIVSVIRNDIVVDDIPIFSAIGLAVTPDGKFLYVTSITGSVVIPVDIDTLIIGDPIPVANFPLGLAITPDQAPTASFVASPAPPGSQTFFDASSSTSPVGTVVFFEWDFGDGTVAATSSPTISHTYLLPGIYTVTLTVTNSAGTSTRQTFTGQTVSNNGGPSAVTSQQITITQNAPLPPSDFTGIIKVNKFLNKRECLLKATWTASASDNVAFYRIFRNGVVVGTIPAAGPFIFKTCLGKCSANGFEIAAVSTTGFESERLPLVVEAKRGSN